MSLSSISVGFVGVVLVWLAKQVLGTLIGQQVKGSVPDYAAHRARAAAQKLPVELREEYETEWLAELATLSAKPLTAIRYANGLGRAASEIAFDAGVHSPVSQWAVVASRGRDIVSSGTLLLLLAPLLSAIALAGALVNRGRPILSRSIEPGKGGRAFVRLRFTTIKRLPNGKFARTRLGKVISRSALDELPVLINVLRGDLSLVGPPAGLKAFDDEELFALKVRPGVVSWQLLAVRGLVRISMEEAKYRDEHRTLRSDAALLLRMPKAILLKDLDD